MSIRTVPERRELPTRRNSSAITFYHESVEYKVYFSQYEPDGRLAEIFIEVAKTGTSANIFAKECAVILSLALQYGTPQETLYAALPKVQDGSPAGPIGKAMRYALTGEIPLP
jgi:hypothetical protein